MEKIKGSEYLVDGVEFASYIPKSEKEDMKVSKIDEVWRKMNNSEKHGCQFGLFPSWALSYKLNHEETVELMRKK